MPNLLAKGSCVAVVVLAGWILPAALAETGTCDSSPSTTVQACMDAVAASGQVIHDIFRDASGLTAVQLPSYGVLYDNWPQCATVNWGGCAGQNLPPYDCPGQYTCTSATSTFANASARLNALDHTWWLSCRLSNHSVTNGCPAWNNCVMSGTPGNYFPHEGLVFDLTGGSNQVAVMGAFANGPAVCEALAWTVYLSNNPLAQEVVSNPGVQGVNPDKWNRARLTEVFTKGFQEIRPPDPIGRADCGDTADYSVEMDAFVVVFSLPPGWNLQYAAIVPGNDGLDFPECDYHDYAGHLDAVAGLNEQGCGLGTECSPCEGDLPDFDGDGLANYCDPDIDNDGVSNETDECDFTPTVVPVELVESDGTLKGDLDGDCDVDLTDYATMLLRFTGQRE